MEKEIHNITFETSKGKSESMKHLREVEFLNKRTAFYIDGEEIIWLPIGNTCEKYFELIKHPEYIDTVIRGYFKDDYIVFYKGKDYEAPTSEEREFIVKKILFKMGSVIRNVTHLGFGCEVEEVGKIWNPKIDIYPIGDYTFNMCDVC